MRTQHRLPTTREGSILPSLAGTLAPRPHRVAPTRTGPASALGVQNPSRSHNTHARCRAALSSIWICSAPPRSRSLAGAQHDHPALAPARAPALHSAPANSFLCWFFFFFFWKETFLFLVQWKIYLCKAPAPPEGTGLRELSGQSRTPLPPDNTQPCFAPGLRDLNTRAGRSSERRSPDSCLLCPPGRLLASTGPGFRGSRQRPELLRGCAHAGGDREGPPAPRRGLSQTLLPPQGEAKGSAPSPRQGWGLWLGRWEAPCPHKART